MFQHQLNVVRGVWRRLESWKGSQTIPTMSLANAPTDKLRALGETLLDILLFVGYEIGPIPSVCFLIFMYYDFHYNYLGFLSIYLFFFFLDTVINM